MPADCCGVAACCCCCCTGCCTVLFTCCCDTAVSARAGAQVRAQVPPPARATVRTRCFTSPPLPRKAPAPVSSAATARRAWSELSGNKRQCLPALCLPAIRFCLLPAKDPLFSILHSALGPPYRRIPVGESSHGLLTDARLRPRPRSGVCFAACPARPHPRHLGRVPAARGLK